MYYSRKVDVLQGKSWCFRKVVFWRIVLFLFFMRVSLLGNFPLACHVPALCLPCPYALCALCLHINRTIGQLWWVFPFCAPCLSFRGITFFLFPCLTCACSLLALSLLSACHVLSLCLPCPYALPALSLHPACLIFANGGGRYSEVGG